MINFEKYELIRKISNIMKGIISGGSGTRLTR
jgi:hypothetical protein